MTDDIDVKECDYLYGDECSAEYSEFNGEIESYAKCYDCVDCHYRLLKRAEQKLEKIKDIIIQCTKSDKCSNCKYEDECNGYLSNSEMMLQIIEG